MFVIRFISFIFKLDLMICLGYFRHEIKDGFNKGAIRKN
jgi:hypothetical protein